MVVTRIFDETDDPNSPDFDYVAIFLSSAAELLGTTLTILLIDRIGRVKTLIGAFFSAGISLLILCVLPEFTSRAMLIFFALVGRAAEMSSACVVWISTTELLSTEILSTGHSAVNAIARTGAFFSPYLVDEQNALWIVGVVLLFCKFVFGSSCFVIDRNEG
jgi:hypothetical protein